MTTSEHAGHGDCSEVLHRIYEYLDGEMSEAGCVSIREHLDECSPCLRKFGLEQEVKALVARSCGCDEVPGDLKDRVRARITELRVELTHVEFRAD